MIILINIFNLLKSVKVSGWLNLIFKEFRRRINSNEITYISYYDLTNEIVVPKINLPLTMRELIKEDIPELLVKYTKIPDVTELKTRLSILLFIRSGIRTCYIGEIDPKKPITMNWLITADMNDKLKLYFKGGILSLKPDEVLCEFLFTDQEYRKNHLSTWSTMKIFQKAKELGARRAIAYSPKMNALSWEVAKRIGWKPYLEKHVQRRMFKRRIVFRPYIENS
jgi:hypothetical protein